MLSNGRRHVYISCTIPIVWYIIVITCSCPNLRQLCYQKAATCASVTQYLLRGTLFTVICAGSNISYLVARLIAAIKSAHDMSWLAKAFRVAGPLWGESIYSQRFPLGKSQWCGTLKFSLVLAWKILELIMTSSNRNIFCYWPYVAGIHRSPVNYPHKGQWRGALKFSLICTRINGCENNRDAGDLRRHRAHYNVTVMLSVIVDAMTLMWHHSRAQIPLYIPARRQVGYFTRDSCKHWQFIAPVLLRTLWLSLTSKNSWNTHKHGVIFVISCYYDSVIWKIRFVTLKYQRLQLPRLSS